MGLYHDCDAPEDHDSETKPTVQEALDAWILAHERVWEAKRIVATCPWPVIRQATAAHEAAMREAQAAETEWMLAQQQEAGGE
jgi:hypothetical protein